MAGVLEVSASELPVAPWVMVLLLLQRLWVQEVLGLGLSVLSVNVKI
ncbi:hypothetical protein N2382_05285 [SAR92 clade bacterium H921]|nr:hypothetical protein [SAR92 clade bacterium H921]